MLRYIFSTLIFANTSLALIFITSNAFASSPRIEENYFISDIQKLKDFRNNPELIIDHVSASGFELYGPAGLGSYLTRTRTPAKRMRGVTELERQQYPSPEQSMQILKDIAAARPDIAQIFSIGKSKRGRELLGIKITKSIQTPSNLPEFKYIANMHGDEIVGRELMVMLAKDLIEGYGNNPLATQLINNLQIYILPSMNPDGAAAGTRYNAENFDLNRDFPEWSDNEANTPDGRAVETRLVMDWQQQHHFVLSANFHGGAEVVNYPWDGVQQPHPLDSLVKSLSLSYAQKVPYIYNSTQFENGITNGWAWYEVKGGMQDWSWYFYKDIQLTIELSSSKWPDYSTVAGYYRDNKPALLDYIAQALKINQSR